MPLERISVGFKDISLSLKRNPLNKDIVVLKNENAIARSLRNLVLTLKGEKFFEPEIGCSVNTILFENLSLDLARRVKSEIERIIESNEPRVELVDVIATPNYDEGSLDITIKYLVIGIDATAQQLDFVLLPTR
jgi:phage baseplate assembly protein W